MRRKLALGLFITTLVAAAAPSAAPAAVRIDLQPSSLPPTQSGTDTINFVEVYGTDLDGSNERLNAYTIAVQGAGPNFGDPNGVRFVVPPPNSTFGVAGRPTDHPYVFQDFEVIPPIENFNSTPSKLQFAATAVAQDGEVNIDPTHSGFLRFGVIVPANLLGTWTITVTTNSLAGGGAPIVSTPGAPLAIAIVPEPSAAGLLLLYPPLALLRRRRA
jgi:hypothetical protein